MSTNPVSRRSAIYVIRVRGRLREDWGEWLGGLTLQVETDDQGRTVTRLIAPLLDQSALHGILARLHALNLELVSVTQLSSDEIGGSAASSEQDTPWVQ